MELWNLMWLLILLDSNAVARKIKRKDTHYHLSVPPPPSPPQPPSHSQHPAQYNAQQVATAYAYEPINHDGYPQTSNAHNQQISRYEPDYVHISPTGGGGFLVDNGLRSIAKGSADQATSAVASQNAAGKQAAYVAKSTLAQAAAQAAGTAIAVLKGKEVLLRRLEEQSTESHKTLENELTQLQQAKRSAKAAQYAAQQAINHVSVLTAALNNAQAASELAQKAASEAAAELASQIDMVAQAKAKLEQIEAHMYAARLDFEETKDSAEKATLSAQEAQLNANDAAVHANVELSESVLIAHDKSDQNVRHDSDASAIDDVMPSSIPHNHRHQN